MLEQTFLSQLVHRVKYIVAVGKRSCSSSCGSSKWTKPTGYQTGVYVYNTLSEQIDELVLPEEGLVRWYCCGPTVYGPAHIGPHFSY